MKRRALPADESPLGKSASSSFVDVAFLTLAFFMVAFAVVPLEEQLGMRHGGEAVAPVVEARVPVTVRVTADDRVWWGEEPHALEVRCGLEQSAAPRLAELLEELRAAAGEVPLEAALEVDDGASQQRFVAVLDDFAAAGVERVGLRD